MFGILHLVFSLTRGGQHQRNYRSKNKKVREESAIKKHAKEVHGDKIVNYRIYIIKTFKTPMERQVYESIKFFNSKAEDKYPLNSKNSTKQ